MVNLSILNTKIYKLPWNIMNSLAQISLHRVFVIIGFCQSTSGCQEQWWLIPLALARFQWLWLQYSLYNTPLYMCHMCLSSDTYQRFYVRENRNDKCVRGQFHPRRLDCGSDKRSPVMGACHPKESGLLLVIGALLIENKRRYWWQLNFEKCLCDLTPLGSRNHQEIWQVPIAWRPSASYCVILLYFTPFYPTLC